MNDAAAVQDQVLNKKAHGRRGWKRRPQKTGEYGIREFATEVGITPAALRIWELRYGWPEPKRNASGYRIYTKKQVEIVKFVAGLLEGGRNIGDVLADSALGVREGRLPAPVRRKVIRTDLDFSLIPQPTSEEGRRLRRQMEDALRCRKVSDVTYIESQACRLRAVERDLIFALKRAADTTGTSSPE